MQMPGRNSLFEVLMIKNSVEVSLLSAQHPCCTPNNNQVHSYKARGACLRLSSNVSINELCPVSRNGKVKSTCEHQPEISAKSQPPENYCGNLVLLTVRPEDTSSPDSAHGRNGESDTPLMRQLKAPLLALRKRLANTAEDGFRQAFHTAEDLYDECERRLNEAPLVVDDLKKKIAEGNSSSVDKRSVRLIFECNLWQSACLLAFAWGVTLGRCAIFSPLRTYVSCNQWFFFSLKTFFVPANLYIYYIKHILSEESRRYSLLCGMMAIGFIEGLSITSAIPFSKYPPALLPPTVISAAAYVGGNSMAQNAVKFSAVSAACCLPAYVMWGIAFSIMSLVYIVLVIAQSCALFLCMLLTTEFFQKCSVDSPINYMLAGNLICIIFNVLMFRLA